MDIGIDEQVQSGASNCEKIKFETYPNSYSRAFAERQFTEQIMLDPIENVYEKFQSTERTNRSLFRNGLIYKY